MIQEMRRREIFDFAPLKPCRAELVFELKREASRLEIHKNYFNYNYSGLFRKRNN